MTNIKENSTKIFYAEAFGNRLTISKDRNARVIFSAEHERIEEPSHREDYRIMSFPIIPEHGKMYQMVQGLFEQRGTTPIVSEDPIREGNNRVYLEEIEDGYYLTIVRDQANELNQPCRTNISSNNQYYLDLYDDILNDRYIGPRTHQITKKASWPKVSTFFISNAK